MNGFGTRDNTQVEGRFVGFCGFWLVICGWWILDFAPPPPPLQKIFGAPDFLGPGEAVSNSEVSFNGIFQA